MILSPILLAASLFTPPAQVAIPAADEVVIRTRTAEHTRGELAEWLLTKHGETYARGFADAWLYAREARRLGLPDVTEEARAQVEAEIDERVQKAHGGREEGWLSELKQARRTPAGRRAERLLDVIRDLDLRNVAAHERVVPREKVVRDWEREYGPGGRRYRVRLLFRRVVMPPMGGLTRAEQIAERDRVRDEKRREMLDIRARAEAGEPFPGLVRDLSEDPSTRGAGGRPKDGFLNQVGWPPEAIDAIAALDPGAFSDPIFVQGGFWLVQLEEVVETPLESVEDELHARLVERGPEPDELAQTRLRLVEDVAVETLPALHERAGDGPPLAPDVPVLRIDGAEVTRGEYAEHLLDYAGDVSAARFAEERHVERLAAEAGIAPTPAEIEARVEEDVAHLVEFFHGGDRERWAAETARVRGSVEAWWRDARNQRRMDLLLEGLFARQRVVTDEMVRQLWRTRYGVDGRSLHLRMIRIDAIPPELPEGVSPEEAQRRADEAIEAAREQAAEVAERAQEGEDFAALAKRFSMDEATRDDGGELPLGFDHRTLPPDAVRAVEALRPGQVSGAIEVGVSHLLFELVAVRDVPYESVAEELRRELETARPTNVESRGHYNVLTRDLAVEVLPALFR